MKNLEINKNTYNTYRNRFTQPLNEEGLYTIGDRLAALREVERILLDHGHKQSLYGLARHFESKRDAYKNSYDGVDKKFGLAANCCHKLDIELKNIQHGVDAEHVLFKHVHTFHNSNSAVLKNLSLYVDGFASETDALLILPSGIFLIDAKYRSVLTTSGMEDFAKIERQKVNILRTLLADEELTSNARVRNALENHLYAAIYDHKANIIAEDCELAVPVLSSEMAILRFVLDKKDSSVLMPEDIQKMESVLRAKEHKLPCQFSSDQYDILRGLRDVAISFAMLEAIELINRERREKLKRESVNVASNAVQTPQTVSPVPIPKKKNVFCSTGFAAGLTGAAVLALATADKWLPVVENMLGDVFKNNSQI